MIAAIRSFSASVILALTILALAVTPACTPQQIQTAQQITAVAIADVGPVLQILVATGVLGTAQQNQAQQYADEAQKDYALVQKLIADYKAQPSTTIAQKIQSAIIAGNQNLQAILAAFHVADPQKEAALTGAIGLIVANMAALIPIFPVTATATAVRASNQAPLPSPDLFKKQMDILLAR